MALRREPGTVAPVVGVFAASGADGVHVAVAAPPTAGDSDVGGAGTTAGVSTGLSDVLMTTTGSEVGVALGDATTTVGVDTVVATPSTHSISRGAANAALASNANNASAATVHTSPRRRPLGPAGV